MTHKEINTIEHLAKYNRITELLDYLNTRRNELIVKAREAKYNPIEFEDTFTSRT